MASGKCLLAIFCCPIFIVAPYAYLLFPMWLGHSLLRVCRRWTALSRGIPVLEKIDYTEHFGSEFRAGRNQNYRVTFRFEVDGEQLQGVFETTDDAVTSHDTGEPIWVVYLPKKPHVYATWPPFA